MIASFGELFLWMAWLISAFATVVGWRLGQKNQLQFLASLTTIIFGLVALGFVSLIYVFVTDDFSVWLVVKNSHPSLPWYYKVGAAWGNHEGSMLLWVFVLSGLALLLSRMAQRIGAGVADAKATGNQHDIMTRAIACQEMIFFLFTGYLLFTSNPFLRFDAPADGSIKPMDLNPLLQDPGLIFHPPFLYGGFVGLSALFSLAVGIMATTEVKKSTLPIDKSIIYLWRFFIHFAFIFLSAGIIAGSFWAYYELGWGGFWFWDPVENISLIPWLLLVALVHGITVYAKTGQLKISCLLLSILTFGSSLIGTFLVRSGLITSVHSFASDPSRGLFMLTIIGLLIGGASGLWLRFYYKQDKNQGKIGLFSRHGLLVINNMLFYIVAGLVFIGLVYPLLLLILTGKEIAVGAAFFNITVLPFFVLLAGLLALGFFLPDNDRDDKKNIALAWKKTRPLLMLASGLAGLLGLLFFEKFFIVFFGLGLAFWLLLVTGRDTVVKWRGGGLTNMASPLAHAGFALIILGVVGSSTLNEHKDFVIADESEFTFHDVNFKVDKIYFQSDKHFRSLTVQLTGGGMVLKPAKRIYAVGGQETTEVAIHSNFFINYYAAIGNIDQEKKQLVLRLYYQPLIMFIFLGGGMMALSGVVAACRLLKHFFSNQKAVRSTHARRKRK